MQVRKKLKRFKNKRITVRFKVERFGYKYSFFGPSKETLLATNVTTLSGELLTDHLWFTKGEWSKDIKIGDIVELDAKVTSYMSGYRGSDEYIKLEKPTYTNYRLSYPRNVKIVSREEKIETNLVNIEELINNLNKEVIFSIYQEYNHISKIQKSLDGDYIVCLENTGVKCGTKMVPYQILYMESQLGRKLKFNEYVYFKDGNKNNLNKDNIALGVRD